MSTTQTHSEAHQIFQEANEAFGLIDDLNDYAEINHLQRPVTLFDYIKLLTQYAAYITHEVSSEPDVTVFDLNYAQALRDLTFELHTLDVVI